MFEYKSQIERSVEATIKTLATKDDLNIAVADLKVDMSNMRKENADAKAENIKWMFIFWIGQVAAMLAILLLFIKKIENWVVN